MHYWDLAAEHPAKHRTVPTTKSCGAQMSRRQECWVRNPVRASRRLLLRCHCTLSSLKSFVEIFLLEKSRHLKNNNNKVDGEPCNGFPHIRHPSAALTSSWLAPSPGHPSLPPAGDHSNSRTPYGFVRGYQLVCRTAAVLYEHATSSHLNAVRKSLTIRNGCHGRHFRTMNVEKLSCTPETITVLYHSCILTKIFFKRVIPNA